MAPPGLSRQHGGTAIGSRQWKTLTINTGGYGRLPSGFDSHQALAANFSLPDFDPVANGFETPRVNVQNRPRPTRSSLASWQDGQCPTIADSVLPQLHYTCAGPVLLRENEGGQRVWTNWFTRFDSTAVA